jgi:hypothetical protein
MCWFPTGLLSVILETGIQNPLRYFHRSLSYMLTTIMKQH